MWMIKLVLQWMLQKVTVRQMMMESSGIFLRLKEILSLMEVLQATVRSFHEIVCDFVKTSCRKMEFMFVHSFDLSFFYGDAFIMNYLCAFIAYFRFFGVEAKFSHACENFIQVVFFFILLFLFALPQDN